MLFGMQAMRGTQLAAAMSGLLFLVVVATPTTLAASTHDNAVVDAESSRAVDDLLFAVNQVL